MIEINKHYDVKISESIYVDKFEWINNALNILFKVMSIILIVGGFTGEVGAVSDRLYIESNLGMSTRMQVLSGFIIIFNLMYFGIRLMIENKPSKVLISNICVCYVIGLLGLNYMVYIHQTNDIKTMYLLVIYITVYLLKHLIDALREYNFWIAIYEEGIKKYGYKYKEYKEVYIRINEELSEKDSFSICINKFNYGEKTLILHLVKFKIRLNK